MLERNELGLDKLRQLKERIKSAAAHADGRVVAESYSALQQLKDLATGEKLWGVPVLVLCSLTLLSDLKSLNTAPAAGSNFSRIDLFI